MKCSVIEGEGSIQMFTNKIVPNNTGITLEDLTAIEKEYDFKFPEDIKEFYLKYNAGKLEKRVVRLQVDDWIGYTTFGEFYSVKTGDFTLEQKLEMQYEDDWRIRWKWLVPFGSDEGGEDFCFSIRDCDYGYIYYFESDNLDEDNPENSVIKVGDNFTDFINNMVSNDSIEL